MSATFTYDNNNYSDLFKDVYGFRPRGGIYEDWLAMSPAEKQKECDYLVDELRRIMDEEEKMQKESAIHFEKRVTATIALGAKDRETALRWIYNADIGPEEEYFDWDFLCYLNGLRYGYFKSN